MTSKDIASKVKDEVLDTYPQDGINIVIPAPDNYAFQLTSTSNELQALNQDNNDGMSIINLNDCERLLKQHYNISENATLIILKYEKMTGVGSEKSIQYEIYNPNDFKILNLYICENTDIDISIPIYVDEEIENLYYDLKDQGYDLFDRNSRFYIDICTPFQAENGADVLLVDRVYYFFSKVANLTICPSNCQYSSFSIEKKYLSCQCDVDNESIDLTNTEKFIGQLFYNLTDYILKYTSYKTMKCYKLVFSFKHFIKNAGSIILLILFLTYFGFFIYFLIKGLLPLKTNISKLLFDDNNVDNKLDPFFDYGTKSTKSAKSAKIKKISNNAKSTKSTKSTKSSKTTKSKLNSRQAKSTKGYNPPRRSLKNTLKINFGKKDRLIENKILASKQGINNNKSNNNSFIDVGKKDNTIKEEPDNKSNIVQTHSTKGNTNNNNDNNKKAIQINAGGVKSFYMNFNIGSSMKLKPKENSEDAKSEKTKKNRNKTRQVKFKEILESNSSMIENQMPKIEEELDDYELNHLGYLAALKLDKRNCCQIYCSLLKRDQNIMYTCITCNDYNLLYVKAAKFIFVLATLMAMNAFLFADKSFHKLFMSGVHYYFSYQVLQMSLSIIITYVVEVILCYVTFTDRYIYEIKSFHKNENNLDKIFKILKFVRNKLLAFFIVALVVVLFYWYLISAFCAVYPNTQKNYLIDCTISFAVFSIIPFFVYAISALLRVISLKDINKKRFKCLYKAGQTFPIF